MNIQSASQVSTLVPDSASRAGKIAPVEPGPGTVNANQAPAEPTGAPVVEAATAPQTRKPAARSRCQPCRTIRRPKGRARARGWTFASRRGTCVIRAVDPQPARA